MIGDYVWNTGNTFSDMRLIIEGAIVLYEDDALPLYEQADVKEEQKARNAFDTIGSALYSLRRYICELQTSHGVEVLRELEQ